MGGVRWGAAALPVRLGAHRPPPVRCGQGLDRRDLQSVLSGHRRDVATADPADHAGGATVHRLQLEPLPRSVQPQGVPDSDPDPRDRDDWHIRSPGLGALLRVLRGRTPADVLHDRRVGRGGPALRVAQVLPIHAVRVGSDAGQLPGVVLPDWCRNILHHWFGRRGGRRWGVPHRATVDLRWHVPGFRHQGADVPVPHLAAGRPHPGTDGWLGDPGRRAVEARNLRLHKDRHPGSPRRCGLVGPLDRPAGGGGHHLRRPGLSGPDRREAAHCVLVGGPHGLCDAGHRHAYRLRHQRGDHGHGRPRPHHRHALLLGRFD